jgi:hypothetical protein
MSPTTLVTGSLAAVADNDALTVKEEFPALAGFTPGYWQIEGVNLHYLKGGTGPLVLSFTVMVRHGTSGTSSCRCWPTRIR